jgi:UDP-N-acetylmuramoyl-tripeptide--D-alanyl-D-alanine ligase
MMTLADAQALLPGSTLVGDGGLRVERVHSDSRSLRPGDLFVALQGERFDAHDFLPHARAAGAVAAIATHGLSDAADGLPGLRVADTLVALQTLAAGWRARMALPLIAVTGSNGKTTVTQMLASVLRAAYGDAGFATAGNLNNHIGVPLTLLRLRQDATLRHRAAAVELGMNHPGEIALLASLAAPTVALVNNAQREHQEFMADVGAVARENGSVFAALAADGTAVFPADDAHTPLWRELAGARRVLSFALREAASPIPADVSASADWQADDNGGHWSLQLHTPAGEAALRLRAAGLHNVRNALAAAACALAAGVPLAAIVLGLERFEPVSGRSQLHRVERAGRAFTLVDDAYNANPDSVLAAIEVLAGLPAPRWLILGDMGEVGERGAEFHAEVGARAAARGIDSFWAVGALSAHAAAAYGPAARHFERVDSLLAALPDGPPAASVLVKGSRFMRMERVVQALRTEASDAA